MKPLSKFCRLCQNVKGKITLKDNPDLISCIIKFLNIEVQHDHKCFPAKICLCCVNKLKSTSIFIEMVQEINTKLNMWMNKEYPQEIKSLCSDPSHVEEISFKSDGKTNQQILPPKLNEIRVDERISNENVNKDNNFKCFVCFQTFDNLVSLENHKVCHMELNCKVCKEVFRSERERNCHFCIKQSIPKKELDNTNILIQAGSKMELNTLLPKEYVEIDMERNASNCDKSKSEIGKCYLCETCGKTFKTKNSLSCHEKIHLGKKLHCCQKCNLTFTLRGNLLSHVKKHHEGQKFLCSQCTKEFLSKDTLLRHEKTHLGLREFQCESCSKAFYTSKELKKHQRYHQGLKLFKCEQCFQSFFERHHLIVHVRRHTGERPYSCTIIGCEKSFVEKQKLKRHINQCHKNLKI